MLEVMRSKILTAYKCMEFEQFFNLHLMAVQDQNITAEVKQSIKANNFNVLSIEKLAQKQHERLVN